MNEQPGATEVLGLEASGTIVEFGSECVRKNELGQNREVMALLSGGGFADYV